MWGRRLRWSEWPDAGEKLGGVISSQGEVVFQEGGRRQDSRSPVKVTKGKPEKNGTKFWCAEATGDLSETHFPAERRACGHRASIRIGRLRNTYGKEPQQFPKFYLRPLFSSDSLNGNLIKPEEAKVFEDEKRIICF